jgi:hypothetical protein
MLDLFSRGVLADDEKAVRRAFYNRVLPDGSIYAPPGKTIDIWRAYQANELCHIALEALLNALVTRLQHKPTGEHPDTLIADTIGPIVGSSKPGEVSWEDWAEDVGVANTGSEETLAEPILAALQDTALAEDRAMLESAMALLAVLWARWRSTESSVRGAIEKHGGKGGRSLVALTRTFDSQAKSPILQAVAKAVRIHVISDHLAIAGRKLAASGTFTYHFTSADGVLADGRTATYGYTNPRLRNLVRFLRDTGLYDESGVTSVGKKFLNDCQPV